MLCFIQPITVDIIVTMCKVWLRVWLYQYNECVHYVTKMLALYLIWSLKLLPKPACLLLASERDYTTIIIIQLQWSTIHYMYSTCSLTMLSAHSLRYMHVFNGTPFGKLNSCVKWILLSRLCTKFVRHVQLNVSWFANYIIIKHHVEISLLLFSFRVTCSKAGNTSLSEWDRNWLPLPDMYRATHRAIPHRLWTLSLSQLSWPTA